MLLLTLLYATLKVKSTLSPCLQNQLRIYKGVPDIAVVPKIAIDVDTVSWLPNFLCLYKLKYWNVLEFGQ